MKKRSYVYVLSLEENKFYVGKTTNPKRRIKEHLFPPFKKNSWTAKYKPLNLIALIPLPLEALHYYHRYEDTLAYQIGIKVGCGNIRGGVLACNISDKECQNKLVNFQYDHKFDLSHVLHW